MAESNSEVGIEGGVFRHIWLRHERLPEQVELSVLRNDATASIENHVRVEQLEPVFA